MGCGNIKTGYKGQRYEVRFQDEAESNEHVFGWCNDANGGVFVESINLNPSMHSPRVVDLSKEPSLYETVKYQGAKR